MQNHSFTFCEPVTIRGHSSHSDQHHSQRMIFALRAILACFPRIGANCEGLFVASHLCPFGLCVSYCRWQPGSTVCFAVRLFCSSVQEVKATGPAAQGYRGWSGDFQASSGHRKLCLKNREVQNSRYYVIFKRRFGLGVIQRRHEKQVCGWIPMSKMTLINVGKSIKWLCFFKWYNKM